MIKIEAILFSLFALLLGIIVIFAITSLIAFFYAFKLNNYLKKNRYNKWCELTTLGQWGPGAANPFKGSKYFWNDLEDDDNQEKIFKRRGRKLFKILCIVFFSMIINVVIFFIVGYMASRMQM